MSYSQAGKLNQSRLFGLGSSAMKLQINGKESEFSTAAAGSFTLAALVEIAGHEAGSRGGGIEPQHRPA